MTTDKLKTRFLKTASFGIWLGLWSHWVIIINNNNICLKSNIQTSSVDYAPVRDQRFGSRRNTIPFAMQTYFWERWVLIKHRRWRKKEEFRGKLMRSERLFVLNFTNGLTQHLVTAEWFDSAFGHSVTTLDQVHKKQKELDQKQDKSPSYSKYWLTITKLTPPTTFCKSIMLILKRRW